MTQTRNHAQRLRTGLEAERAAACAASVTASSPTDRQTDNHPRPPQTCASYSAVGEGQRGRGRRKKKKAPAQFTLDCVRGPLPS